MKILPGAILCLISCCMPCLAQVKGDSLLVVLSDTQNKRNGLPVLDLHPQGPAIAEGLRKGFPLKMLHLYRYVQVYLNPNRPPEPAYRD